MARLLRPKDFRESLLWAAELWRSLGDPKAEVDPELNSDRRGGGMSTLSFGNRRTDA